MHSLAFENLSENSSQVLKANGKEPIKTKNPLRAIWKHFENYRMRVLAQCGWNGIINRVQ
jgi:hypothetical protein